MAPRLLSRVRVWGWPWLQPPTASKTASVSPIPLYARMGAVSFRLRASWQVHGLTAAACPHGRHDIIGHAIGNEFDRPVAGQEIAATRMQAPEMELVARVLEVARPILVGPGGAGIQGCDADTLNIDLGHSQGHVTGAGVAHGVIAVGPAEVPLAGAGIPPAEIHRLARRALPGHQGVA